MNPADYEQRIQTICLLVLSTIATAAALYWLSPVLIPFVLALFFAVGLAPLIEFLVRRLRFPQILAITATLVLFLLTLGLISTIVTSSLSQLSANSGAYQAQLSQLTQEAQDMIPWQDLGLDPETSGLNAITAIPSQAAGQVIVGTTNAILDVLSKGFIVMIFTFFLIAGGSPSPEESENESVRNEVRTRIKKYLISQTAISAATGALVWLILSILGVDLAAVFGLFAFLLNFIPNIGSVIATLLPLPVVLISPDISTTTAVLAIALPGVLQFLIGNVVAPMVMGDVMNLHPVTVLLALMFWGALWGIVGMLLATPITAILRLLMERFEITAPLADLMAGKKPRTV